jgi:hypothetical protein
VGPVGGQHLVDETVAMIKAVWSRRSWRERAEFWQDHPRPGREAW